MKNGEEMWKTELETLQAIASIGIHTVRMHELIALYPNLGKRAVYYRVDRLIEHGLVTKEKVDERWIELSITPEGERML